MRSQPEPSNLEQEFERYAVLLRAMERIKNSEMASEFLQLLAAGKTTVDSLKILTQYASEIKDTQKHGEFMRIIGQLYAEIAESEISRAAQTREIENLSKEIERLRKPDVELVRENGLYFDPSDKTFPFCPNCYVKSKDYRVLSQKDIDSFGISYRCPDCAWEGRGGRENYDARR